MRLLSDTFPPNRRAEEATEEEQVAKIREEDAEFYAALDGDGDPIEECIDSMLARDGWLEKQQWEAVRDSIFKVSRKGQDRGDWDLSRFRPTFAAVTRCRDCRWMGRESIVAGEYRCNRTERVTGLDDYCSKAVRRDA